MEVNDEVKGFLEELDESKAIDETTTKETTDGEKKDVKEATGGELEGKEKQKKTSGEDIVVDDEYKKEYEKHLNVIKNLSTDERRAYVANYINNKYFSNQPPQQQYQQSYPPQQYPQYTQPQAYQQPQQQPQQMQLDNIPQIDEKVLDDITEIYPEIKGAFSTMKEQLNYLKKQLQEVHQKTQNERIIYERQMYVQNKNAEIENIIGNVVKKVDEGKGYITPEDIEYVRMKLQSEIGAKINEIMSVDPRVDFFTTLVRVIGNTDIGKAAERHFK